MRMDDIQIDYPVSQIDDHTILATGPAEVEWAEQKAAEILKSALDKYSYEKLSTAIPTDYTTNQEITLEWLNRMASGLNSSKDNQLTVNAVILQKMISDSYVGRAFETIMSGVNTDVRITDDEDDLEEQDVKELAQVKKEIDYFNNAVDLKRFIRECVERVYAEGNCPVCLRCEKGKAPSLTMPPLSLCYPSDYCTGDRKSVMEFDVKELKSRLQKTYKRTRKNKAVYYQNIDDEIKSNYDKAIYDAHKAGENYVKLDPNYNTVIKINDLGRKYGVSPLFRTLRPLLILENIEQADMSDSMARSKKIVYQKMRKEAMGQNLDKKGFDLTAHAHDQAAAALKANFNLYTSIPAVEGLEYVQAKTQNQESIEQTKLYTQKLLTSLGIEFSYVSATVGSSKISVTQIVRLINAIAEQIASVLTMFYRNWLRDNGHDEKFAPHIKIIDAEQLDMDLRKELSTYVYSILNASRETAFELLGMDATSELMRRKYENDNNYDQVFTPRRTAYTSAGDTDGYEDNSGRPTEEQTEVTDYDKEYTETVR